MLFSETHVALLRHGFDRQGLVWHVLPKKPVGQEQEKVLFDKVVHVPPLSINYRINFKKLKLFIS